MSRREESIETLRGIAILLVVVHHAIDHNFAIPDPHGYLGVSKRLMSPLILVRMPLFAAISGYVFARVPLKMHVGLPRLLKDRATRLLVPFLSITTLTLVMRRILMGPTEYMPDGSLLGILTFYVRDFQFHYPFQHLWFLQSLFLVVSGVVILEYMNALSTRRRWLAIVSLALLGMALLPPHPYFKFFCVLGAVYLAPYFLLGMGVARFPDWALSRKMVIPCALIVVAGLIAYQLILSGVIPLDHRRNGLIAILVGVAALPVCFRYRVTLPWLPLVATYSYTLYLFHYLGIVVGLWITRSYFHTQAYAIQQTLVILAALALPMLAHHVIGLSDSLSWAFWGTRRKKVAATFVATQKPPEVVVAPE